MGRWDLNRRALTSCVAFSLLIGCGEAQSTVGSQAIPGEAVGNLRPAYASPEAKNGKPVIYVAEQSASAVMIYPEAGGQPIGEITDGVNGPYGLYVDKSGTLYVANEDGDTVTAYPAGSTVPSMTWSEDLNNPHYPIVNASGDLFVSNQGNGTVVEYRPGSSSAYQVLQTQGTQADGMDFDQQGNLYVAFRTNDARGKGGIEEFAPGTSQGEVLRMKLNEPQGLIVNNSGKIAVVETGKAHRVNVFLNSTKERAFLKIPAPPGETLTQLAIEGSETELFASALDGSIFTIAYPLQASEEWNMLLQAQPVVQGIALSNGQTF